MNDEQDLSDEQDLEELVARAYVAREYAAQLAKAITMKSAIHPRSEEDWQLVYLAVADALELAWEFINAVSDFAKKLDNDGVQHEPARRHDA
jgi:hypothetical protein